MVPLTEQSKQLGVIVDMAKTIVLQGLLGLVGTAVSYCSAPSGSR